MNAPANVSKNASMNVSMNVLELNDVALRLFEGERLVLESPGCAALDGRRLLTGADAQARLRLDPRRADDRFWHQLDATLPVPLGAARSAADLAHAQLQTFGEALTREPLILAAPASATPSQLGVLLGVLQALGARCAGLVDSAVAAASDIASESLCLHLDVQRHRLLLTRLEGQATLGRTQTLELKPGLDGLQDRCAGVIAEAFVRHARFDPLHSALTEQALYDRLPGWMQSLAQQPQTTLELEVGGRAHRISLTRQALEAALADRLAGVIDAVQAQYRSGPVTLLLSDRAAALPGLAALLPQAQILDAAAAARGALRQAAHIVSGDAELPWVTRLPRQAADRMLVPDAIDPASEPATRPTHALIGHDAHALPSPGESLALSAWLPGAPGLLRAQAQGWVLQDAQSSSVRINAQPAGTAQTLHPGDQLSCNGHALRLIRVLGPRPAG